MSITTDIAQWILGGGPRIDDNEAFETGKGISDGVSEINDWTSAFRGKDTRLSGPLKALAPLGVYSGLQDLFNGDTMEEQVGGGLEAGSGFATIAEMAGLEAAGPIGAVIAAANTGWSVGTEGNKIASERGQFGENEDGSHRSISQALADEAMRPGMSGSLGPGLLAGGALAAGNVIVDPFLDLAGVEAPISTKQQNDMNNGSRSMFETMRKAGMSDDAAMHAASLANPNFREQNERLGHYDTLVKSGLPFGVANMLTGVTR